MCPLIVNAIGSNGRISGRSRLGNKYAQKPSATRLPAQERRSALTTCPAQTSGKL